MDAVTSVERLEAIIGTPSSTVVLKAVHTLDEGCRRVLAASPVAGFGFRDATGGPRTVVVGGAVGFARAESPTRLSLELPAGGPAPVLGSGVSLVLLVPGIGETLRVNGHLAALAGATAGIDVDEAYVHCARCVLRSGLWGGAPAGRDADPAAVPPPAAAAGPVADAAVAAFAAASPFVLVSSWDADGAGDTSPRGDAPGFVQVLDGETLAIPDRRGNKRADTLHNLLTDDRISLAALVPGRDDVLHLSGSGRISEDPALLATMRTGGTTPGLALLVHVHHARIEASGAVRGSALWDLAARAQPPADLDLNQVASQHMARNEGRGAAAALTRTLGRGLAGSPKLLKRAMDANYTRALKDEGY